MHYHIKLTTGGESIDRVDSLEQYIICSVTDYHCDNNKIYINGIIKKINNGDRSSEKIINNIILYRIYTNENTLFLFLDKMKEK